MKISKILCCVDVDPLAEYVFEYGFNLAQKFGADLALVSILDINLLQGGESGVDIITLRNDLKKEIHELFNRLLVKNANKNIAKFYDEGDPKKLIVEIGNSWNADIIVIASHARTGLSRIIIGSVAEFVMRHSRCPVLVIPARN